MNRRLMLGILTGVSASGGSGGVQISDRTIRDTRTDGATAQASYSLLSNGVAYRSTSRFGPFAIPGEWTSPTSPVGADYEAKAELVESLVSTATLSGDVLDTWLRLDAARTWTLSSEINPVEQWVTLLISIRRFSDSTLVATATITLNVITVDGELPI